MTQERMNEDVIYIVNLNHENKRNLEALQRKVYRQLREKERRYVSRAEKQIMAFLVMAGSSMAGIVLLLCGYHLAGMAALVVAMIALGVSSHYEP